MWKLPSCGALLVTSSVMMLCGCGDCPPSKYVPPQPETTESLAYELNGDGTVTEVVLGREQPPRPCDAACMTAFQDPSVSCQRACTDLAGYPSVTDCSFDKTRTSLSCTFFH